jgi:hypothetical protein
MFCMTNIGLESEYVLLRKLMSPHGVLLYRYPLYKDWRDEILHLTIEQCIASKADYFIPSGPSFEHSSSPGNSHAMVS